MFAERQAHAEKTTFVAFIGEAHPSQCLNVKVAEMCLGQGAGIQAADVLKFFGSRSFLGEAQRETVLPWVHIGEQGAIVDESAETQFTAGTQRCDRQVKAEDYHLIDAVASFAFD